MLTSRAQQRAPRYCGSAPTSYARRSTLHSGHTCWRRHPSGKRGSTFMLGATRSSTGTCAGTLWTLSRGKAGFNGTAGSPSAARLCVSWEQTSGPNAKPEKAPGRQFSVWPNNVWPTNPAWPWLALSRYALLVFLEVGPGEPTNRHASIVLQFQEKLSSRRIPAFDLSLHRGSDLLGAHNEG